LEIAAFLIKHQDRKWSDVGTDLRSSFKVKDKDKDQKLILSNQVFVNALEFFCDEIEIDKKLG
jgi:hypothetical protein